MTFHKIEDVSDLSSSERRIWNFLYFYRKLITQTFHYLSRFYVRILSKTFLLSYRDHDLISSHFQRILLVLKEKCFSRMYFIGGRA